MKPSAQFLLLIEKYLAGQASEAEIAEINTWYQSFDDSEIELLLDDDETESLLEKRMKQRLLQTLAKNNNTTVGFRRIKWYWTAAAIFLITFCGALFFLINRNKTTNLQTNVVKQAATQNDIAPGGNRATLTLADGSTVVLDSATNGIISTQANVMVEKSENGTLVYIVNGKKISDSDEAFYNTISTPRGGQYSITLSDGSKVILNASSSIRFPVQFNDKERKVEVTGETYFEIAKNPGKPFSVKVGNSKVEVFGTHFNVNAYTDEDAIKTTLLEGKVKVIAANQSAKFLLPGQQSSINKNGNIIVLNNADTEEAVAWVNGRFQYKSAGLKDILKQISRWYDVDVEYKRNVNMSFTGQLNRSDNVLKVLEKLKLTGEVNFTIEGRKIIVSQ